MFRKLAVITALVTLAVGAAFAQEKKFTVADFVGTWNIEVMSHQVALVIEQQEGNKVTGTMMMMGRDVPLKGELVDRTITFTGVKAEGDPAAAPAASPTHGGATPGAPPAKPIIVSMQDDGTLAGEMMTTGGPVKWVGEKLRSRKKPQ